MLMSKTSLAQPDQRQCAHPGCPSSAYQSVNKRTGKLRRYTLCNVHRNQAAKAHDLAAWSYRKHKSNAKRRGILFTISLEYFRQFAIETEVLIGAGRTATSLHVDRKIDELGYVEGNLQVLTNTENVRKENLRRAKRKIYDYELAARLDPRYTYQNEAEAAADAGVSVFRFVDDSRVLRPATDDPECPF